jgi:putative two-component system response regulator
VVLVVDDSEEQTRFLRRLQTRDGYQCVSAPNGSDAPAACASGGIDIVLLDVHLPGMDGLTVCRQLKGTPDTCLIPVLVMTGDSRRESQVIALEAGADDFLEKPLAVPELRARVRSASRMKRFVDELDNAAASVLMLGAAIEACDRHTNGHCRRSRSTQRRSGGASASTATTCVRSSRADTSTISGRSPSPTPCSSSPDR